MLPQLLVLYSIRAGYVHISGLVERVSGPPLQSGYSREVNTDSGFANLVFAHRNTFEARLYVKR